MGISKTKNVTTNANALPCLENDAVEQATKLQSFYHDAFLPKNRVKLETDLQKAVRIIREYAQSERPPQEDSSFDLFNNQNNNNNPWPPQEDWPPREVMIFDMDDV